MNSRDFAKCVNAVVWAFKIALKIFGVIAALAIVYAVTYVLPLLFYGITMALWYQHPLAGIFAACGMTVILVVALRATWDVVRWARKKAGGHS